MRARTLTSTMRLIVGCSMALGCFATAWARPEYQGALFARYPNAAMSLPNCVACHDGAGSTALNPFGNDFLNNGFVLDAALEALDSDGDGATNGEELKASPATGPGDPTSKPGSGGIAPPPPQPPAMDGATLYANNCAACHGALPVSTKAGATLARVQSAIAIGIGGMGYLSMLSISQLEAIVSALSPGTAPTASANYTGIWWNPAESGWGININHQGDVVFATLFTYDEAGTPLWVLMSGSVQADGKTYSGDLYRTNGPAFNAQPFTPLTTANLTRVGTMSLTFSSVDRGNVSYTYQGTAISKDIVQQVFGSSAAACRTMTGARVALTNFQDMWWNPSESGWGVNIAHQDDILFATLFTYDLAGSNLWLVMLAGTPQPDGSYLGDLYRTHGPAFSAQPFLPLTAADLAKVGTMRFVFVDGNTGTMSYSIEGISVVKTITRQVFSSPVPACSSPGTRSAPTTNGATLYANHCAACHGALASSSKGGASLARVQGAIAGNVGGMGYLSTLSTAELEAIVAALAPVAPGTAAACGSCHAIPPGTGDHGRHNTRFTCSSCHGTGYSSSSVNAATHNNGVRDLIAGAGWNAASQSCTNSCHGTGSWSATATLPCGSCHAIPPGTGDHGRHNTRFTCSSCHGTGYSSSSVNAATHNNGIRDLIAGAGWNAASQSCTNSCHGTGSWSATATLPCTSCHGVPPTTGHHDKHKARSCSVCHGTGYDSTTVNAATHINGVKDVIASTGWDSKARTCSNSCHGRETW